MAKKQIVDAGADAVSTDPVTFTPTDNFSIAINGTIVTFTQGQSFAADATMQAALAAANAPVV